MTSAWQVSSMENGQNSLPSLTCSYDSYAVGLLDTYGGYRRRMEHVREWREGRELMTSAHVVPTSCPACPRPMQSSYAVCSIGTSYRVCSIQHEPEPWSSFSVAAGMELKA